MPYIHKCTNALVISLVFKKFAAIYLTCKFLFRQNKWKNLHFFGQDTVSRYKSTNGETKNIANTEIQNVNYNVMWKLLGTFSHILFYSILKLQWETASPLHCVFNTFKCKYWNKSRWKVTWSIASTLRWFSDCAVSPVMFAYHRYKLAWMTQLVDTDGLVTQ